MNQINKTEEQIGEYKKRQALKKNVSLNSKNMKLLIAN